MTKKYITIRLFGVLALALVMASCVVPPQVALPPTPDLRAVRTEAAQTVVVKITLEAALNPSATPEAPAQEKAQPQAQEAAAVATATPTTEPPTATPKPTDVVFATATRRPTSSASGGNYPTRTPRRIPDAAILLSYSPEDGAVFHPGNQFDAVWTVKNTGASTWTTDYHIRYASGANMSETKRYYLSQEVKPGEQIDLVADMVTPAEKGIRVGYWEFVNGNGDIIYHMYVAITVE